MDHSYVPGVNLFGRRQDLPPDPARRSHALARLAAAHGVPIRAPATAAQRTVTRADERRNSPPDPPDDQRSLSRRPPDPPDGPGRASRSGAWQEREIEEEMTGGWVPQRPERPGVGVERLRDARLMLSVRHVVVIAVVLVVGIGWAVTSVLRARPVPVSRPVPGIVTGSAVAVAGTTAGPGSRVLVVDVAGKVRRPGLVRIRAGARVADVIAAAGGAQPGVDLSALNLARPVADGEQILVGVAGPPPVAGTRGVPGTAGGQVDLNTATAAQLEELPGVGPVLAQRIVDWRTEHGRFSSVDELQEVSGVGERKFADLRPHVRV